MYEEASQQYAGEISLGRPWPSISGGVHTMAFRMWWWSAILEKKGEEKEKKREKKRKKRERKEKEKIQTSNISARILFQTNWATTDHNDDTNEPHTHSFFV